MRCIDQNTGIGLRGGLTLSILLHAGFFYFAPAVTPRPLQGKPSALNVTLVRQQTENSRPAVRPPTDLAPSDALRMAMELTIRAPGNAAPQGDARPESVVDAAYSKDAGTAEKAVRRVVQVPRGKAGVVLVIGPSGVVGEIIWGDLPVMATEHLQSIERVLRQRRYPALGHTYPANEIIDPQSGEIVNSTTAHEGSGAE